MTEHYIPNHEQRWSPTSEDKNRKSKELKDMPKRLRILRDTLRRFDPILPKKK